MPIDRDRLVKILGLTTSSNDGEALSALRKANEIIKGENLTWSDVLAAAPTTTINISLRRGAPQTHYEGEQADWSPPHLRDAVMINMMFKAVFSQPRTGNEEFWQFMDSIHHWFEEHKSLTQRQFNALRTCYQRVARASARG